MKNAVIIILGVLNAILIFLVVAVSKAFVGIIFNIISETALTDDEWYRNYRNEYLHEIKHFCRVGLERYDYYDKIIKSKRKGKG